MAGRRSYCFAGEAPPLSRSSSCASLDARAVLRDARVELIPGIYASVLVAAFGGVRVELSHGSHAKVHPFFMVLCCVPLFLAQVSAILFLRTDLKVYEDISDSQGGELTKLKFLMIVVLYLINFKMLFNSAQLFVFIFNPVTWVEVEHPRSTEWGTTNMCWLVKLLFSTPVMVLWVTLSMLMNLIVGYMVCVDSVSVILDSDSAKDVIFDSLALTFIGEMNRYWWDFCSAIFHLKPIDRFRFRLTPPADVWNDDGEIVEEKAGKLSCPRMLKMVVALTKYDCLSMTRSFLSRGSGARRAERVLSLTLMYVLYKRQLLVVLFAMRTKVLPAARDICAVYRARTSHELQAWAWRQFDRVLLVRHELQLHHIAEDRMNGECYEQKYAYMTQDEINDLHARYRPYTLTFSVLLFALLVLPTVVRALHRHFLLASSESDEATDDEQEREIEDLKAACKTNEASVLCHQQDIGAHEKRLARMEQLLSQTLSPTDRSAAAFSQPPPGQSCAAAPHRVPLAVRLLRGAS